MAMTRLIMKLRTRADGVDHSIESICTNVTMNQACNSSDGNVEFDMLDTPDIKARFGDVISLILDGKVVFVGNLFAIERSNNLYLRHYKFYDETFYLRNSITMPVPEAVPMITLVQSLLDKYEIYWTRLDDAGEIVNERKIQNVSIMDAIMDMMTYITYMYNKMYVIRPNAGAVEFIDIESSNISGFQNSYPLVIEFSNSEDIETQTYNYFEFYKVDDKKNKSEPKKGGGSKGGKDGKDSLVSNDLKDSSKNGTSKSKSTTTYKYLTPIVPYEEQAINLEIAMYAVGGINSAQAKEELSKKPEIKDDTDDHEGYTIGSKAYKLTGEVALWGYLPMIKEVKELPPEEIVNALINVKRNPVRSAKFTVLVHGDFHLPGDKLFIGENEEIASVYVINSVTTTFRNDAVIQELNIFSWQKTFDVQKLILAEHIKKPEAAGGQKALREFAMQNNVDLIYKESTTRGAGENAGFVMTDDVYAQVKQTNADLEKYFGDMDNKIGALEQKQGLITQ